MAWRFAAVSMIDGAIACADQETGDQAPTPKLRKIRDIAAGDEYICAIHGNRARISCFHVDIVEEGDDPLAPLDSSALIHIPHVTGARVLIDVRVRDCFVFLDADGVANTFCLDGRGGDHELIGPNPWPVLPPGDDLVAFGGDMCVLGRDRTISCAGPRDDVARVLPYTDVEAIDAYGTTLCLIQDGGALTCTGPNSVGQLGTPPRTE